MEINKLGKITKKISVLVSCTFVLICMLSAFYYEVIRAYEIQIGKLIGVSIFIGIGFFIVKYGLSNYSNYSNFITGNISKTKYLIYSAFSVISIILVNLATLFMITGNNLYPTLVVLLCSITTIPNIIFMVKSFHLSSFKKNRTINIPSYSKKIKSYFSTMELIEVIAFSMIIGVVGGLLLGYIGGDVVHKKFHFNYLIGVSSFLIIMGILCLVLNKRNKRL